MTTLNTASPVQIQIQNIFGVRSQLDSSLFFCDEHTIIYPAGNQFVLANVETKIQRIFRCNELEHIDWILVHTNAAVVAVVASGMNADKQNTTISFYDLHSNIGKRKRMFELSDTAITITSMAFSHDAKHLAILECGNREYTLSLWLWQKSRIAATLKLGPAEGVTILSQVLFHPNDNNLLSIVGKRYCRSIRHLDGNLRIQSSSAKLDQYDFISHAWYDSSRFIAGTNNGYICILFNGDVQTEIDIIETREKLLATIPRTTSISSSLVRTSTMRASSNQQEHADTSRFTGEDVTSIVIVNKGFFCLVGGKRLCLFTKIADSWDFAKTREYIIPTNDMNPGRSTVSFSSGSQDSNEKQQLQANHLMWKVVVSPREEHVLILSSRQQIYSVSDMTKDQTVESKDPFQLELIFNSFHHLSIRGLDIAVQKPLFISSGDDHTVRLWNYETSVIEQMRLYSEPVYGISIHPSGHQLVVAFASKVSLLNVLIDGFATVKEYPIHAAHEVKFSNGGQFFAVIDANIIQIISPVYLKVIHRINHGQTVRKILWKKNDLALYSQSTNYFVIWNLENQKKIYELKPSYRLEGGFVPDREDRNIYLACDDGFIRTFCNGQIINEAKLPQDDKANCLEIFPSNGAIICGTHRGSIYVLKTPLSGASTPIFHYLAHSAKITQIAVAFHEALIISCCEDGILILWETQIKSAIKPEDWTPVVLHNKQRFIRLSQVIEALQVEELELKRNQEYQLKKLETTYLADLQRRTDMSVTERKHHEDHIERQLIEKEKSQRDFDLKLVDLREKFANERQRIEDDDRENLSRELQKEGELIRLSQKMMEDNEARLKATIEARENEMRDTAEYFTGKIRETEHELVALRRKNRQTLERNEIEKKNLEADIDDEHLKVQLEFEDEKRNFSEANDKLKIEFKDTFEYQAHNLHVRQTEQETATQTLKKRINDNVLRVQGMNEEIGSLKNELNERKQTINEKQERISDLELKNQELEKFQYVLRYKIDELTRLIQPREQEIERMKNQLLEMASEREKKENELSRNRFVNGGQKQRLHAVEAQVDRERQKRKEYDNAIRRIKNDISLHFADVSDPQRVQNAVAALFEKHVQNDNAKSIYNTTEVSAALSEEVLAQDRQRLFLERTTSDLKRKLNRDLHTTQANQMRVLNENSLLLQELNSLRQELKIVRSKIQDYEVARTTFDERGVHSIDALIQTLNADAGNYAVRHRDNELVKEVQKNQQEILRLRKFLARSQAGLSPPPLNTNLNDETENISILKLV
ncbi:unnamed protein product [Rotaria socialis]|uniref:WD repeat-containing protein 65 n=1 Tax=Rotaria socialis TaxID=392032 RepID=A0A817Y0T1_9BILA|nr:unnamed protein product [Rotaria socialis]CAF3374651.1 unnamed protein product [Rotaria socialis]CAF4105983.1 unnamed protein product [Rotaria socialis]